MVKQRQPVLLFLKGMMMGAADIIPGVSGGTIALITGIYEDLIFSLGTLFDPTALSLLRKGRIIEWWKKINGRFLLILISGILTSVFLLARLIGWLFQHYPLLVWAFFTGLIGASGIYILHKWRPSGPWQFFLVVLGMSIALFIAFMHPLQPHTDPVPLWFVFLSGALGSIAMILPGISGSYILILIGMYRYILDAVHRFDPVKLMVFTAGVAMGLAGFSRFLKWLFKRHEHATMLVLGGFLIGSLGLVWPWKNNHRPVCPRHYAGDPQLLPALIWIAAGFILIFVMEKIASRYGR